MRDVASEEPVDAPAGFVMNFLATSFGERRGGRATFTMAVSVPLGMRAGGTAITKDVDVTLSCETSPAENRAIGIRWAPRGGGAFPTFIGRLRAEPVDETHALMKLEGRYAAPGGTLGRLFDVVAGTRIAEATLRQLLETVRAAIEADYRVRIGMAM
jgi:hypothetical protein